MNQGSGALAGLGPIGWIIGGVLGGLVGAAIWAAISYATQYEIGYIAIGVGFLVGVGVRMAAGDNVSSTTGAVSAAIAIVSVLAGKYLTIYLLMQNALAGLQFDLPPDAINDDAMVAMYAEEIVEKREAAGETVTFPAIDETAEDVPVKDQYPEDIYKLAVKEWEAVPEAEKQSKMEARRVELKAQFDLFKQEVGGVNSVMAMNIFEDFGPMDYVFIAIAAWTAFSVGGRSEETA